MKRLSFFTALAISAVLVSCSKKDETVDPLTASYAQETVDQGKANLETSGQKLVTSLETLKDSKSMDVMQGMSVSMSKAGLPSSSKKSAAYFAAFESVVAFGNNKADIADVYKTLRKSAISETPSTIQSEFDNIKGIYTYSSKDASWTKTSSADDLELLFPSTETGTTNNAKFVVTLKTTTLSAQVYEDLNGNVPTEITATLSADNVEYVKYEYKASYNSNGIPTSLSTSIKVDVFKMGVDFNYSSSNTSIKYSFTQNSDVIVEMYAAINGNLDYDNISKNIDEDPASVINNANAYFQVMNIKLVGKIDFKTLSADMTAIDKANYADTVAVRKSAESLNKNAALVLVYADSNQKIASCQAYSKVSQEKYYDYTTYSYKTETVADVDVRFVFADGTSNDIKTYLSKGFEDLQNDIEDFMTQVQTEWGK